MSLVDRYKSVSQAVQDLTEERLSAINGEKVTAANFTEDELREMLEAAQRATVPTFSWAECNPTVQEMASYFEMARNVINGCKAPNWITMLPQCAKAFVAKVDEIHARKSAIKDSGSTLVDSGRMSYKDVEQHNAPRTIRKARLDAWHFPLGLEKQLDALFIFICTHPKLEKWMGKVKIKQLRALSRRFKHEVGTEDHRLFVRQGSSTVYFGGAAGTLLGILSTVSPASTYLAFSMDEQRTFNRLHHDLLEAFHAGFYSEKLLLEQQEKAKAEIES